MDQHPLAWILLALVAYLFGSIPTAFLVVKLKFKKNIYQLGSGNGGATNVYRMFGKIPGFLVFIIDFSKGFLPLLGAKAAGAGNPMLVLMTFFALLGHSFPLWTRFKGGKGVAVTAGTVSALFPMAAPFCLAVFGLTLYFSKYVSLSSMAAALTLPLVALIRNLIEPIEAFWFMEAFFLLLFLIVLYLHRSNICRLIKGVERQITDQE